MTIQLSVADVRAALLRAAGSSASAAGSGEAATLLLGRLFHEVFADLVGPDPLKSGLRVIAETSGDADRAAEQLIDHAWRRLIAPRLRRHAAALQTSSDQVLVLWRASQNLARWLGAVVIELIEQSPRARGSWQYLARLLQPEVPLAAELHEPGWSEPVRLVGIADSVLSIPDKSSYCAIELKLGRATPVVDLGQAALYHLVLSRSTGGTRTPPATQSALALMRFSPDLQEHVVEAAALAEPQRRLLDLIGRLAGVARTEPAVVTAPQPLQPTAPSASHDELGKRLLRAYKQQGVQLELAAPPQPGPRFVRFDVRLAPGMKLTALKNCTAEIQHRLELRAEPMIVQEGGRLYVDLERPDPQPVPFAQITAQLPAPDPLHGSARIAIGVDAAGRLHTADLASSGRSHVLAAGTTGSGKSEWLRTMLASLIAANTPDTLRLVTIDPKLSAFADLERSPFLLNDGAWWIPGDGAPASEVFQELIEEMERRYQLTRQTGSDNLREHVAKTGRPLPRIVCVCDEYFALVSQSKAEKQQIEHAVSLLGAKARAAGIHLVLATQQPSRATISGAIQANLPCRVALLLRDRIESQMILNSGGAERLTGAGDLLYKDFGSALRLQAPLLSAEDRARYFRA